MNYHLFVCFRFLSDCTFVPYLAVKYVVVLVHDDDNNEDDDISNIIYHIIEDDCYYPESCNPNPCANGGTCTVSKDGRIHTCSCLPDYIGAECEIPLAVTSKKLQFVHHNYDLEISLP